MHIGIPLASVLLFLVSLMFLVGLMVPPEHVLVTVKNTSLLVRALVANLVLMPLLAILITTAVHLPEDIAIGVLLMAAAPGVPFLPRMAGSAKGNLAFAVGLMLVLQVASVVTTPVTLNLILPADAAVRVPVLRAVVTLALFQLLPLGLGMLVRHGDAKLAGALVRPIRLLSLVGLVGTVVFFIVPHLDVLGKVFGGGALLIMLGLVVVAWPIGWTLGGPDIGTRKTMALGTSLRNVGLCLLVATRNFPETGVPAAVGSYLLIQAVANLMFSRYLGRAPAPEAAATAARHV